MKFYEVNKCGWGGESYFFTVKADAEKRIAEEFEEYGTEPILIEHEVKASRRDIAYLLTLGMDAAGGHPTINAHLEDEKNFGKSSR